MSEHTKALRYLAQFQGPPTDEAMITGASMIERLLEALTDIRMITGDTHRERPYTALSEIDQIARKALA